jgi:hypothetical protein
MSSLSRVEASVRERDEEKRLDRLAALVGQVRSGEMQLTANDLDVLLDAQAREEDDLIRVVMWELLEYAPPHDRLRAAAEAALGDPSHPSRGLALSYLLSAYPETRPDLLRRYDKDPDPYVQNCLAGEEAAQSPRQAVSRWMRLLADPSIPPDLAETVPYAIAEFASPEDVDVLKARAAKEGEGSIWASTVAVVAAVKEQENQG